MTVELRERPVVDALSIGESERLRTLEAVVEAGLQTFVQVGTALAEIQRERYYRQTHASFEEYLEDRWGLSKSQGYRAIAAAGVVLSLPEEQQGLLTRESQVRPLVGLDPDQARDAVQRAASQANGKPLTAALITDAVREVTGEDEDEEEIELDRPLGGAAAAVVWELGRYVRTSLGLVARLKEGARDGLWPAEVISAPTGTPAVGTEIVADAQGNLWSLLPEEWRPEAPVESPIANCDQCGTAMPDGAQSRAYNGQRGGMDALCAGCTEARYADTKAEADAERLAVAAQEARQQAWEETLFDLAVAQLRDLTEPGRRELAFLVGTALASTGAEEVERAAEALGLPWDPVRGYLVGLMTENWDSAWLELLGLSPLSLVRLGILACPAWAHAAYLGLDSEAGTAEPTAAETSATAPAEMSPIGDTVPAASYAEYRATAAPEIPAPPRQCPECGLPLVGGKCPDDCTADYDCPRCGNPVPYDTGRDEDWEELPGGVKLDPRGHILTPNGLAYCRQCRPHVAICRNCGCTDEAGCDGGCSWVAPEGEGLPDLCSECLWEPGRWVRRWQDEAVFRLERRILVCERVDPNECFTSWSVKDVRDSTGRKGPEVQRIDQTRDWSAAYTLLPRDYQPGGAA